MPMNLTVAQEGGFTPYLKYNAKAGRWFVKGENGDVEIDKPRMAVDLENGRSGWLCFPIGGAPISVWDSEDGKRGPRPDAIGSSAFKEGFEIMIYGPDKQPGLNGEPIGIREWCSNSNAAKDAVIMMNQEYQSVKADHPGQVPVFQVTGIKANEGQYGTNYTPTMSLTAWIDRSKVGQFDEAIALRSTAKVVSQVQETFPGATEVPPTGVEDIDDEIPF